MIRKPDLFILDEPTSAVDIDTKHFILESLERYLATNPALVFIVTHQTELLKLGDKIVFFENGKLIQKSGQYHI
ncbi:MAG: hypothetical protein GX046_08415 [Tissierellia bacterium]|nr:hypothetical protein [Tissierellia bacterium]